MADGKQCTADLIKLSLMRYFRFKRQMICVDECMNADIVADAGNHIIEVEVKISVADLRRDRKKRHKHQNLDLAFYRTFLPNKFYYCVPEDMRQVALEFIQELNPKYGLMIYQLDHSDHKGQPILVVKNAMLIHGGYSQKFQKEVAKRASCKIITLMEKMLDMNAELPEWLKRD